MPLRTIFPFYEPFRNDARIDGIALHYELSRSRSARMTSLLSTEDRRRGLNLMTREAKFSSLSSSTRRKISLCSASADRPRTAALCLSARTTSWVTFRTVSFAMRYARKKVQSLRLSVAPFKVA